MRIAQDLGMPFGTIFDVGVDISLVEICLKLFLFAKHEGKEKEYTLAMASAIWADGVDIEDKGNVERMLKGCGLSMVQYKEYEQEHLQNNEHILMTQRNLESLHETGNWGVPSIQIGSTCVWGQDRLWAFARNDDA